MRVNSSTADRVAHTARPRAEPALPDAGSPRLDYRPALDGIRALALVGVLLFHNGYRWAPGGFLGVSTFFTLSGFLITTLALTEWADSGRLSPARFYERRARRLLPAALLTLVGIVALRAFTDVGSGSAFRGDMLSALGYTANWRFASSGHDGYAALFAKPSPVLHFWSLAIEEQFYLAFPPLFVGVMALVRRLVGRRSGPTGGAALALGGALFGVVALGSFAAAYVLAERNGNDGTTYYGTHTRAGELLAGVTLAFVVRSTWFRRVVATWAASVAVWVAGPAALAALVWVWQRAWLGDPRLFQGIVLLNAGLTCVVIVAALQRGPAALGLGLWPLRGLGKISYAAYLFHWPIFLWLAPPRVDVTGDRLFLLRVLVTLAAATASYHLLEAPFRFRLRMPRPRLAAGLVGAGALAATLVLFVPQHRTDGIDFAAAAAPPTDAGATPAGAAANANGDDGEPDVEPQFPFLRQEGLVKPLDGKPATVRILLAGDSLSASLISGLDDWNQTHPDEQIWVDSHAVFSCPLIDSGVTPIISTWPTDPQCVDWHEDIDEAMVKWDSDVVLLVMGLADLLGHRIDGQMRDMGDAVHDEWFTARVAAFADTVTAPGVPLVWSNFPHVRMGDAGDPTKDWTALPVNEPRRVERFNEILRSVLDTHPEVVQVDMDAWTRSWPEGAFDPARRDGVHFHDEGADLACEWLIPQLIAAADAGR